MPSGTVAVKFVGDIRNLERDMDTLGGKFSKFGRIAATAFAAAAAGAAVFAVKIGKDSIEAASNLEESLSKVNVVFGDSSKEMRKWAAGAAKAFGQSEQQALEAAGTYGNLFQAFGVGRDESAGMSKSLVELAADLASFNNTSVDDALLALRSGLSGETEPLKRYGVALNDIRLKEEARKLGLIKTTKEALTPGAKAQAAYALIMKDSTLAQGDFKRTSGGLANQQRILAAQFENMKAKLGKALLPTMLLVVTFLTENLIPAFEGVAATVAQWWPEIVAAFQNVRRVIASVVNFVSRVLDVFRKDHDNAATGIGKATSRISKILDDLREMFAAAFGAVRAIVQTTVKIIMVLWDGFGRELVDNLKRAFENILGVLDGAIQILTGMFNLIKAILTGKWGEAWEAIKQILAGAWKVIHETIATAIEGVRIAFETGLGLIKEAWNVAWNSLKTLFFDIWEGIKAIVHDAVNYIIAEIDRALGPIDELAGSLFGKSKAGQEGSPKVDIPNTRRTRLPGRAKGGPVMPWGAYTVGEDGPELLRMGSKGGHITPNGATSTQNVTINMHNDMRGIQDRDELADGISRFTAWRLSLVGGL